MMKARSAIALLLVPAALCGGLAWWALAAPDDTFSWRTDTVTRRDVRRVVSATGTLAADPTVDVGTQVSGIVSEILVDFNHEVRRGQVIAHIDTALLDADVAAASARLAETRAQRDRLALERDRAERLHAAQAATDEELAAARADAAVADAQVRSSQVTLDRARRNLRYATITAPIDGTVVSRAVDVGQTVNAGFSAPVLFQIAGDLQHMTILVSVDESDIGLVHEGQVAEFSVQAYAERTFQGTVRQVRLDARMDQSVVTYTVVVDVDNPEKLLFPGMTATVEFIVAEAKDVLCVANAALRYRPEARSSEGSSAGGSGARASGGMSGAGSAGTTAGGSGGGGRGGRSGRRRGAESTEGTLWTLDGATEADGALTGGTEREIPVKTGLRGSDCTEVSGEGVVEGLRVVLGVDREAGGGWASPFAQQAVDPRRRGGF